MVAGNENPATRTKGVKVQPRQHWAQITNRLGGKLGSGKGNQGWRHKIRVPRVGMAGRDSVTRGLNK